MASVEIPRTTENGATATAPVIINGLTVRPREKVTPWLYAIVFLPDFAVLLVIAGLGMRRLLRYLDAKGSPSTTTRDIVHGCRMSLKTADKILSVFEMAIYALTFAAWAALGFPAFKTVALCLLLILVVAIAYRWIIARQP